jgi:hypothetical protein
MFGTTVQYQSRGRSPYVDVSGYARKRRPKGACRVSSTYLVRLWHRHLFNLLLTDGTPLLNPTASSSSKLL